MAAAGTIVPTPDLVDIPRPDPTGTAGIDADGDRTVLVYRDEASGQRTELSAAALDAWVARTANLLVGGCGLHAGDRAAVLLTPHWHTAVVLLGCWAAGLTADVRPWATAGLTGPPGEAHRDGHAVSVVFATRTRATSWLDEVPAAPHRFLLDLPESTGDGPLPAELPGYRYWLTEVGRQPARFQPDPQAGRNPLASPDGAGLRQWGTIAHEVAAGRGVAPGDRVLVDTAHSEHPLLWLLAPLAAGATLVLCDNLDLASVRNCALTERADHAWLRPEFSTT